jgi:hypothetical protein
LLPAFLIKHPLTDYLAIGRFFGGARHTTRGKRCGRKANT